MSRADRAVTLVAEAGDAPPAPPDAALGATAGGHHEVDGELEAVAEGRWMTASLLQLLGLADRASVVHHPHGMVLN